MNLYIKNANNRYRIAEPSELVSAALDAIQIKDMPAMTNPADTRRYIALANAGLEQEVFSVLFLDTRHRVISFDQLFTGTINGASVYPREVVKAALKHNASAVILAHNHPSGNPEPSRADETITARLRDALALVDVRVLDHIVTGGNESTSFAERGLI